MSSVVVVNGTMGIIFNPFNPEFLKYIPSLHLDTATIAKRVIVVNQEQNGKKCRFRWDGT